MKIQLKWLVIAAALVALGAGGFHTWQTRKQQQQLIVAQQESQKSRTAVQLAATDVVTVQTVVLSQGLPISGQTKAVNTAFVKARVAGELQDLQVREGDFLQAGQVIARIDSTEYTARLRQAQQQAQAAKAQVDIAQRSFDNNRALVDQGFISKTGLDASASNLAAAQASFSAAQSGADVLQKALEDTVLRAPIAGQVAQRLAQSGERVGVDSRIVEIVDVRRLELEATVGAAEALQVSVGQTAQLRFEGATELVAARVVRMNPSATPGSRAVTVYLALSGNEALRQGLYAQGLLATGSLSALALPLSAVRTDKPAPYVQMLEGDRVRHVPVVLGARGESNQQTMVAVSGLPEGAKVLIGGVGPMLADTLISLNGGAK
ncbi:MAG: efflux RND transporter periplasmic adaptor subunit [Rhodoferax sp.]|nr:efflux RND transporter periplasmic adaptor subunit [Rhodoferax sp.]